MRTIEPTARLDVEALTQQLLGRKITRQIFKFPTTEEQASALLTAAYRSEVAYRGRNYVESDNIKQMIARLAAFMTSRDSSKFGVLMCGTYGNGKITLRYALRSVVSYLADCNYVERQKLIVYDARKLAKIYKDRDPEKFEDVCREKLLAIEDMGKEPTEELNYGSIISPITELLEARYDAQRFTTITTNLTPKEIREKYGNRIADRFNEMMCVLNFGAADTFRTR